MAATSSTEIPVESDCISSSINTGDAANRDCDGCLTEEEELRLEKEHFEKIVNAILYYKPNACSKLQRLWSDFLKLPKAHQRLLPKFPAHIKECYKAIDVNTQFMGLIVKNAVGFFENSDVSEFDPSASAKLVQRASAFDMTKVNTTLRQFYRDWSKEGEVERKTCYGLILDEIQERFPIPTLSERSSVKVLVPGSGLGRLAYSIAHLGYCCQGNEFSMYMLLASNFILNRCSEVETFTIYPWVLQTCNNYSNSDQLSAVKIPDANPSDLPSLGVFSMAGGDFLEVYATPNEWDCVACCFFIDTAHNIIAYIEKIYSILKPGGVWINFGPLLYHFADMPHEPSIELSWEDVREIIVKTGFEILKETHNCSSSYIQNPKSMLKMMYECVFMVAKKPPAD